MCRIVVSSTAAAECRHRAAVPLVDKQWRNIRTCRKAAVTTFGTLSFFFFFRFFSFFLFWFFDSLIFWFFDFLYFFDFFMPWFFAFFSYLDFWWFLFLFLWLLKGKKYQNNLVLNDFLGQFDIPALFFNLFFFGEKRGNFKLSYKWWKSYLFLYFFSTKNFRFLFSNRMYI